MSYVSERVILSTLQMIRGTTYANHYRDLSALKRLAGAHGIAILLIHHLRKKKADDVFNRISETTAISGAVNASFTLVEEQRGSGRARLSCIGRDIEYRELELRRNADNVWGVTADSYSSLLLCVNPCAVFTQKTLCQVQSTLFSWRYKTWETVSVKLDNPKEDRSADSLPVSYTHLTLPTS